MEKRVKNLLKKLGKAYMESYAEMYKPLIECNVYPFF